MEISKHKKQLKVTFKYDPEVISFIKSIQGKWHPSPDKFWTIKPEHAGKFIAQYPETEIDPEIRDELKANAATVLKVQSEIRKASATALASFDPEAPILNGRHLFEHQKQGVTQLLTPNPSGYLRWLLADEMGLGKTMQALVAAKQFADNLGYTVVVVCPKSLEANWFKECEMVGVDPQIYSWRKIPDQLNFPYVLISDETHYAQGGTKTAQGRSYIELARNINCRVHYALTGTPLKNGRPDQYWPILYGIKHPVAENKSAYEKYFCDAGETRYTKWDTTGAAHLDELSEKTKPFIIRRFKKDCLDLPDKIITKREVEVSKEAQAVYYDTIEKLKRQYYERRNAGLISRGAEAMVFLGHTRRAGSMVKVDTTVEIAEAALENGPVVIFTEFVETARKLHDILSGELLLGDVTGNDGDTTKRQAMVNRFQSGESRVFISTTAAGGVGITLTASQYMIMVDRPWTPGGVQQAQDRLHRIGQTGTVNIIWLQYGPLDTEIDELLDEKAERIELVMEGDRSTMRGLDLNDKAMHIMETMMDSAEDYGY